MLDLRGNCGGLNVATHHNYHVTSLLTVGEDKGDLLHKGPQPDRETITST